MKTITYIKSTGQPVRTGTRIGDLTVTSMSSSYATLDDDDGNTALYRWSEMESRFGVVREQVPSYWALNPYTGEPYKTGDRIRVADRVQSIDYEARRLHITGHRYSYPHSQWVLWVERMSPVPPVMPSPVTVVDEVTCLTMCGQLVGLTNIRNSLDNTLYSNSTHAVFNGTPYPVTECHVLYGGTRVPPATAVAQTHRGLMLAQHVIDGVPLNELYMVVDADDKLVGYVTDDEVDDRKLVRLVTAAPYITGMRARQRCCEPGTPHNHSGMMRGCELDSLMVEEFAGDPVTRQWRDDNTFVCDGCGDRFHNRDYGSDGYCCNCEDGEDDCGSDDCDLPYGDPTGFAAEEEHKHMFGIEIELEPTSSRRSSLYSMQDVFPEDYVCYKDDGSLSDAGIEVVTRPDSAAVHRRILRDAFSRIHNVKATRSCGVHIHTCRKPLSPLWIGRMLVTLNDPKMEALIRKVAGRYNSEYSQVKRKTLAGNVGGKNQSGRYELLNCYPPKTVEFRLFAGSVDPDVLVRYIEFAEAIIAFCAPAACGFADLGNPAAFIHFISGRKRGWPTLAAHLVPKKKSTKP